jgi:uncharacterized protein YukE
MTAGPVGLNVEQANQLAKSFQEASTLLRRALADTETVLNQTWWEGPDAKNFRGRWESHDRAFVTNVATELETSAKQVRREVNSQVDTSRS